MADGMVTERQGGAAAVEFAILLPLLVVLLFGFIQFGLAFNRRIQATNAAREGARIAAVGVSDWADVDGAGRSFWTVVANRAGVGLDDLVAGSCSVSTTGQAVTVSFDYRLPLAVPLVPGLPERANASATMRVEQPSAGLPTPGLCL